MRNYIAFCPLDAEFNLNSADADIHIKKVSLNNYFVYNYPLKPILSYAFSTSSGSLFAFSTESRKSLSLSKINTCSTPTKTLFPLHPDSSGY